jgi:peroxiredoxin
VSVESDRAHRAFAEQLGLDFPLLSDFNREVVAAYGVQHREWGGMRGMAKRSVFVIAPDGTVRYRWVTDDPLVAPDVEAALAAVRQVVGAA